LSFFSPACRTRWLLRASEALWVSFTVRRLLLVFGSPSAILRPLSLRVRVHRIRIVPVAPLMGP